MKTHEKADVVSDEGKAPGFGDDRWRHSGCSSPFMRRPGAVGVRTESDAAFARRRNGDSVAPWISADGRFVLFSSSASDLVPDDNNQLGVDVFLRDRASNTTVLVSANFSGAGGGNGNSLAGQVSTNGRYAVFQSDASDLLPGDTNGVSDIFVRDLQTGSNILVSVAADGSWGNGVSTDPVMTPDGRYVAFVSAATNLVAGDTNGIADVFVRDLVNGTTTPGFHRRQRG